ncbi:hypothetical protein BO78DRAFT_400007 [Aspergillus sclerotiicarbonarius CBS 121057]|uniref:Uncharacterized protein n=1 Tax=Aspergillus sclerotiicarbonarius (strain CBS 121057 / IBT 28362) TaxID=1448318 RepID=A0A319DZ76_ASPSB|nr:hypothetical protein BO78DRAFT_400007 [Aspergillus sclerotiicarbonarius CBS 121057]
MMDASIPDFFGHSLSPSVDDFQAQIIQSLADRNPLKVTYFGGFLKSSPFSTDMDVGLLRSLFCSC